MKFLLAIVSVVVSLVMSFSFAAEKKSFSRPYGLSGCGLGSVLIGKKGGQIFASTTNGTASNQLFGISSGTLNCVDGPTNEVAQNMDKFIQANQSSLNADIARGNGETISALHQVMGCKGDSKTFGQTLKSNYNTIYQDDSAQANEVTDGIISIIINDSQMASNCHLG